MAVVEVDLGYWVVRLDGTVLEVLAADGTSSRIHARHVLVQQPFAAAVDQRAAPGGMSVSLFSRRRQAFWAQLDVPVERIPAMQALLAEVAAVQAAPPG